MTHSKRLLILLYISILLQEIACSRYLILEKAESFFDYKLCDESDAGKGLKWGCLIPQIGTGYVEMLGDQADLTKLEAADAMVAIQPQTDELWRIVLQVKRAKLDLGVFFKYGQKHDMHPVMHCKIDNKMVSADPGADSLPFEIKNLQVNGYGIYDEAAKMLMCEFIIKTYQPDDNMVTVLKKKHNSEISIVWHDATGEEKKFALDNNGVSSVISHKKGCQLRLEYREPFKPLGDEVYKRFNTDRKVIACPAGFSLRFRNEPQPNEGIPDLSQASYQTATEMTCEATRLMVSLDRTNRNERSVNLFAHCAKKICTMCSEVPPCANKPKPADKCPELKPSGDYESCNKLVCDADRFVIDKRVQIGSPVCKENGGNNTWMVGGAVVTDAVCGDKLTCKPPVEVLSFKDNTMDLFQTMPDLVTCKDNISMSYTPQGDKQVPVKLQEIKCNVTDGEWYESDGIRYQKEHKLECKAESGTEAPVGAKITYYVVGGFALLLVLIASIILVLWCCCGRKKKRKSTESALKHKLATNTTQSKDSKSKIGSGSGSGGKKSGGRTSHDASAPPSFTQKFRDDEDKDGSKPRIPKPDEDAKDAEAKKKAQALLESSKIHDEEAGEDDQERQAQIARVKQAMMAAPPAAPKKGSGQAQKKKKQVQAPERAEDEQPQQEQPDQSEKGQDDALLLDKRAPARIVEKTQFETSPYEMNEINRRAPVPIVEKTQFETSPYEMNQIPVEDLPPAPTQEPDPAGPQPDPEAPSAPRTPVKDRPSRKKTVTADTQIQDEDSYFKTPDELARKDEDTKAKPAAAVVKPKGTVADMPTAKKKEESAKKKNSKKEPAALNEKEKAGARRVDHKADVLSDYESEPKDKVSSRSSKKKLAGGRRVSDEPSRKPDATQHKHMYGSEVGCGPLCMPMPRSHTDEGDD